MLLHWEWINPIPLFLVTFWILKGKKDFVIKTKGRSDIRKLSECALLIVFAVTNNIAIVVVDDDA